MGSGENGGCKISLKFRELVDRNTNCHDAGDETDDPLYPRDSRLAESNERDAYNPSANEKEQPCGPGNRRRA